MATLSALLRREGLSLILGGVVIVLVLNCLVAPQGARRLFALRAHRVRLESQLRRLVAENAELGTRVQRLRTDDRYLERLVRGELGFARPDELIYRFAGEGAGRDR